MDYRGGDIAFMVFTKILKLNYSFSTEIKSGNDALDIKVHYQYHGNESCGLVGIKFSSLYGIDNDPFMSLLKDEIPQLMCLDTLSICF